MGGRSKSSAELRGLRKAGGRYYYYKPKLGPRYYTRFKSSKYDVRSMPRRHIFWKRLYQHPGRPLGVGHVECILDCGHLYRMPSAEYDKQTVGCRFCAGRRARGMPDLPRVRVIYTPFMPEL